MATAKGANGPNELLDHLAGKWIMSGDIGGTQTIHDVEAKWVLNREYIYFHEISRDRNKSGGPAYEAIVYLSWNEKHQRYMCMFLDSTEGGGISPEGIAQGKRMRDSIPLIFTISPKEQILTTFFYDKATDSWKLTIDDKKKDKLQRFADVKMVRQR